MLAVPYLAAAESDAVSQPAVIAEQQQFIARIHLHTAGELADFLSRADQAHSRQASYAMANPIAMVLHGPEVELFRHGNYSTHKMLIDKAAQLDALDVIDVVVCETYMRQHNIRREELPAFVETVPFGPDYEESLSRRGYQNF